MNKYDVTPEAIKERDRKIMLDVKLGELKGLIDVAQTQLVLVKSLMINLVHMDGTGHDPENFRGCTHPDCVELRMYFKGQRI